MNRYELEQRIKRYIKQDGRSQAATARKLGYAPDTFNKWIRGVNRVPDRVIVELSELLGLAVDQQVDLLQLAGYTVPNAKPPAGGSMKDASIVFATQIAPDGRALDPGLLFPAAISDLYAVFRPEQVPPGTRANVHNPDPSAYYAYLKVREDSVLSRLGWRWYFRGELINDFEMEVGPGSEVWLQRFEYETDGIFCNANYGPGNYRIVLLLGGNPALSSTVTIVAGSSAANLDV